MKCDVIQARESCESYVNMAANEEVVCYESNSSNSSSSEEENSDISFSSDEIDKGLIGYSCEPEYTNEELKKQGIDIVDSTDEEMSSENSENELNSSRLENLHWCTCEKCCVMPSLIECKCCRECANLLEDKLDEVECMKNLKHFA